jgi:hypothetical protein
LDVHPLQKQVLLFIISMEKFVEVHLVRETIKRDKTLMTAYSGRDNNRNAIASVLITGYRI